MNNIMVWAILSSLATVVDPEINSSQHSTAQSIAIIPAAKEITGFESVSMPTDTVIGSKRVAFKSAQLPSDVYDIILDSDLLVAELTYRHKCASATAGVLDSTCSLEFETYFTPNGQFVAAVHANGSSHWLDSAVTAVAFDGPLFSPNAAVSLSSLSPVVNLRDILSNLLNEEEIGHLALIQAFCLQYTPIQQHYDSLLGDFTKPSSWLNGRTKIGWSIYVFFDSTSASTMKASIDKLPVAKRFLVDADSGNLIGSIVVRNRETSEKTGVAVPPFGD